MRIRIKSKVRFTISMTVLILLLLTSYNFLTGKMKVEAYASEKYIEVTVEKGDTIWGIAKEHKPTDMEIRNYVYLVCKYNGLDNANILPGQKILMPL